MVKLSRLKQNAIIYLEYLFTVSASFKTNFIRGKHLCYNVFNVDEFLKMKHRVIKQRLFYFAEISTFLQNILETEHVDYLPNGHLSYVLLKCYRCIEKMITKQLDDV